MNDIVDDSVFLRLLSVHDEIASYVLSLPYPASVRYVSAELVGVIPRRNGLLGIDAQLYLILGFLLCQRTLIGKVGDVISESSR
jgi:hypothetical protein